MVKRRNRRESSINVARIIESISEMITNIENCNGILLNLNPGVITVTNPLKESKNLAEELVWLVLVDWWSITSIENSATLKCLLVEVLRPYQQPKHDL
jgi:hypothetical protein